MKAEMRCVCGYRMDQHLAAGDRLGDFCPGLTNKRFSTMALPSGKTCSDCLHVAKCVSLFGQSAEDTRCQWFPIRWQEGKITK